MREGRFYKALHPGKKRIGIARVESATRLFEAGLPIEKIAMVTGHKSSDMLRRHTQLRPDDLVKLEPPAQLSATEFIDQFLDS